MVTPKFTSGPWSMAGRFNPDSPSETVWVWGPTPAGAQSGVVVAQGVRRADAHLIAAAPDMYAALECMMREAERDGDKYPALDVARAALAKARGES